MGRQTRAAAFCLLLAATSASAQLVEGQDYRTLQSRAVQAERIEVIEFFFYGCPTCYLLEPELRRWLERNASKIAFRRVPALRRQAWRPLGELFYALEAMGLLPRLHDEVYRAIHEQGLRLSSRSEQIRWLSAQGVDGHAFGALLESDNIAIAVEGARDETLAYDIHVTPSIVVDGRYLTTGEMLGSAARVEWVLEQLLAMASASRAGPSR